MTESLPPTEPSVDETVDKHVEPTLVARPWAAGHVLIAVVVALALGAVLNARDLQATAERQPFGWQRQVGLALTNPLVSFADALGLDEPRNLINEALGRESLQPNIAPTLEAVDPGDMPSASPSPTPSATPTPTPTPSRTEMISATSPMRMYIGGDSMVEIQFGAALADLADDTGVIEVGEIDFDRGSGLSRPDFVDWPARLVDVVKTEDPEVMVLWFGGNDAQPLKIDGVVYQVSDSEWQAEYRSRVSSLMEQLDEAGVVVYWMGLPIPRSIDLQADWMILDEIYQSEAADHKAVTYVRVWEHFAGPDGQFAEYLPNQHGDVVDMRLNDGIHLTTAGAYRAARLLMPIIIDDFGIVVEEPSEGA